jgi:hypothetical protein
MARVRYLFALMRGIIYNLIQGVCRRAGTGGAQDRVERYEKEVEMPTAPEVWQAPGIIYQFGRSGLLGGLVKATFFNWPQLRDWAQDGQKLTDVFPAEIKGLAYIPKEDGCLLLANHPRIDVALVAMYQFAASLKEERNREMVFPMAGELALWGDFCLPYLHTLLSRYQALYPENIIPVPTIKSRPGYRSGRARAIEQTRRALQMGRVVILHPEAQTEKRNVILPKHIYRHGAGGLVREASQSGMIQIPLAIWRGTERETMIRVGEPFLVDPALTDQEAVIQAMGKVAALMPNELRGPFADPTHPAALH